MKNPTKSIRFFGAESNECGWTSTIIQIHQLHEIVACHICTCPQSRKGGLRDWDWTLSPAVILNSNL